MGIVKNALVNTLNSNSCPYLGQYMRIFPASPYNIFSTTSLYCPNSIYVIQTERIRKSHMEDSMRNLIICSLILLALALICEATAPVQLNGSNGQAILSQIAIPVQTDNTSRNSSLWNWGSVPFGYTLNKSGILTPVEYGNWTPSI